MGDLKINPAQVFVDELILVKNAVAIKANLCICYLPLFSQDLEMVCLLHPEEQKYYDTLKFETRKKSYLIGRYSAKNAVSGFVKEKNLREILVIQGIFNQPIIKYMHEQNIQISITHCDKLGGAIAFSETHPMAIDIEKIDIEKINVIENQITQEEKNFLKSLSYPYNVMLTLLWTAKEALSKLLKTGLTTPFHLFEVNKIEIMQNYVISYFKYFTQYKTISLILGKYICSISYPKNTELKINIEALMRRFNYIVS